MKSFMLGLFLSTLIVQTSYAQQSPAPPTESGSSTLQVVPGSPKGVRSVQPQEIPFEFGVFPDLLGPRRSRPVFVLSILHLLPHH